jgi:hypothetical protein
VLAQSITNAGITNFNPLIISGFGYSQSKTTLMATPQAAVALVVQVVLSLMALYIPNIRCLLWMLSCLPALAGAIMVHGVSPDIDPRRQTKLKLVSSPRLSDSASSCVGGGVSHGLLQRPLGTLLVARYE